MVSMLTSSLRGIFGRNSKRLSKMAYDLEVNRIVWIDMEMTGLDIKKDTILEIACIITDSNLNIVAEGPNLIIQTPEQRLNEMNEWCKHHHGKTGLTEAAIKSQITLKAAEDMVLDFVQKYVTKGTSPVAGNSVYMDKLFLREYMPKVDEYLHYRIIDTSTIKELCRRWNSDMYKTVPKKEYTHRALQDIKESIEEMKYYQNNFFNIKRD